MPCSMKATIRVWRSIRSCCATAPRRQRTPHGHGEPRAELLRSLKFTLFSASAGLIQIGAFALCNDVIHLPAWLGYLIALVLSVLWNFTLNRRYTFRSAASVPRAMALVALFYLVFTPCTTWLEHWLTDVKLWNDYLVTALNMVLNLVLEFLYDRFVVFRGTIDSRDAK